MTAPVVSEARKVMMATTATRARPEIVACGTIGVSKRGSGWAEGAPGASSPWGWPAFVVASVVDMQTTLVQHETARVELIHQRNVVGGDDDRSPGSVELDEQSQQPLRQIGIDIARRLVGEKKLRPRDHRPRDRRALLLSAREHRWQRGDAIAEPDPAQQFDHLLAITVLGLPDHPQRQCHVLEGRHVVEQAEILKHDADAPPQRGQRVLAEGSDIVAEQRDQSARGPQREKQQTQKRGLAGTRGPGEELERTLIDTERKIAQDLGTKLVAQAHVFEPDHLSLRTKSAAPPGGAPGGALPRLGPYSSERPFRPPPLLRVGEGARHAPEGRFSLFSSSRGQEPRRPYRQRKGTLARILIAEDEDAIRNLIARALRQDGHDVITAIDGAQALDVLAREKGAFELLLTDIRMPVMDGITLAHAAARNHPDVTVVLMTGYADQRERAHGLDALIHDVITKPFSLGTMRRAVNDALCAPPRRGH